MILAENAASKSRSIFSMSGSEVFATGLGTLGATFLGVDLTGFLVEGFKEGTLDAVLVADEKEVGFLGVRRTLNPSIDLVLSINYNYSIMVMKLTKKQLAVLDYLQDFTEENGYSPSYRELQAGLGLSSVSAVAEHIDNLVSKGVLKKVPGAARSLEILDYKHEETVNLFKARMLDCTEEEKEVLEKAAEILNLDLS